jgi:fimbrial chaperone protein
MRERTMNEESHLPASARGLLLATMVAGSIGVVTPVSSAAASTFTVDPTQIFLSEQTRSVLLRLHNDSSETLRFQLSVFAWTQSASGEMTLEATQDIVFFPALVVLQPSEERRVRVGSAIRADVHEKTYRIFVEELPPMERGTAGAGVRVLTKMGIPIFLRPGKESASATLSELRQASGRFQFRLSNTGTVHFVPQEITLRGMAGSSRVFERRLESWYVLAGGRRDFDVVLPQADCARISSLLVEVRFSSGNLVEGLQAPTGTCSP